MTSVDEEERLSRLARLQRVGCGVLGAVSVLPLIFVLASTPPAAMMQWNPEAVVMALIGGLAACVGAAGARRRSTTLLNLYFILALYQLYTAHQWVPRLIERYRVRENKCEPVMGTWSFLHHCDRRTALAGSVVAAVGLVVVVCLAAAVIAHHFQDRLAAGVDQPLSQPKLERVLRWCDAEGDGLICLYEFVRYHLQLKFIPPGRLSLLRHNFGECDPLGSGTLPQPLFRSVYLLTFCDTRIEGGDSVPRLLSEVQRSLLKSSHSHRRASRAMSLQAFKRVTSNPAAEP
eukprot:TRINITY_DN7669_c0_g1_i1.p1 TRINITY_DN7669_c0_g1~~TRINITY_DN7669_c0_g1_i1.p1  ORF type:complete len:289 (+),score=77.62 TRINITY_DN7669_c0_g1_i1:95-961(+)